MKRGPKQNTGKAFQFFTNHFDRTMAIAIVAVLLISWVKYKSERFQCVSGNCIQITNGEFLSRIECKRNCDLTLIEGGIANAELQPCKSLNGSFVLETQNSAVWGDTMSLGNVWYTNDFK